jgi:hypothetical protein
MNWTRLLARIGQGVLEKQPAPAPFPPPDEWGQKDSPAMTAVSPPPCRSYLTAGFALLNMLAIRAVW